MLDEHARAGLKAIEERRFDDAVKAFQAAHALAPERPDINHALGMAFLRRGDAGNALPRLEDAVRLAEPYTAPEHQALRRDFHLSLATAQQLLDRVAEARATLEQVVRTWPDAVEARLQLGQLLLSSGQVQEGCTAYDEAGEWLDREQREQAEALVGATRAFLEADTAPSVFLEAHGDSYRQYFDQVASAPEVEGWYAEAERMKRGEGGELQPVLPKGARPYALSRVDLVDPATGQVSSVYSESEPMIVAIEGLEPLAQVPIVMPWAGFPFEVGVSTRCPWHWLSLVVQLQGRADAAALAAVDEVIGAWYLDGYNGTFGDQSSGRFHYVTDPEPVGSTAVAYTVDLGRARFEAIGALLERLQALHDRLPLRRVQFGEGRITA
ncbi:MAG: tetratricopeptide repeat protein [Myxococcota bacterium]